MSDSRHPNSHPPDAADLVALFPELEIGKSLGAGGMGCVYEARQLSLDRRVALKLVKAEGASPERRERFEREAKALARLNHPHIVALFDVGERGGWFYLVMELMEGDDLAHRLLHGALPSRQALEVATQVCEALIHAHAAGVVHRDIKPANILLGSRGEAKLADFGLAKLPQSTSADLTGEAALLGTPHYMPPEQRRDSWSVDERADLYALGVVLYEMLTGGLPEGRFALPSHKLGTSPTLDETVMQAMATEPAARFQTAQAMRAALQQAARENVARRSGNRTVKLLTVVAAAAVITFVGLKMEKPSAAKTIKREPLKKALKADAEAPKKKLVAKEGRTELHLAVERGDMPALIKLVQGKQDLDKADKEGWTPLLLAVAQDRADMIEALHLAGAKHETPLPGNRSAMHIASGFGAVKAAVWLKAHGAALDSRDAQDWRPIDWAAACLQPDMVRWLVQQGVDLQTEKETPQDLRPLHLAADAGHHLNLTPEQASWLVVWREDTSTVQRCADTVRVLLEFNTSIHEMDAAKLSPLHHAAAANQAQAVALLIDAGADANHLTLPEGLTPMVFAAEANATTAMRMLFEKGAKANLPVELESPLHKAAHGGHLKAVKLLLEHEAKVNQQDLKLATPLHHAARLGHLEIMKLLLAQGGLVDARDIQRCTPLHHAASTGQMEATRLLCEKGAAVSARDSAGATPSSMAAQGGHTGVVGLLESYAARQQEVQPK